MAAPHCAVMVVVVATQVLWQWHDDDNDDDDDDDVGDVGDVGDIDIDIDIDIDDDNDVGNGSYMHHCKNCAQ